MEIRIRAMPAHPEGRGVGGGSLAPKPGVILAKTPRDSWIHPPTRTPRGQVCTTKHDAEPDGDGGPNSVPYGTATVAAWGPASCKTICQQVQQLCDHPPPPSPGGSNFCWAYFGTLLKDFFAGDSGIPGMSWRIPGGILFFAHGDYSLPVGI